MSVLLGLGPLSCRAHCAHSPARGRVHVPACFPSFLGEVALRFPPCPPLCWGQGHEEPLPCSLQSLAAVKGHFLGAWYLPPKEELRPEW